MTLSFSKWLVLDKFLSDLCQATTKFITSFTNYVEKSRQHVMSFLFQCGVTN